MHYTTLICQLDNKKLAQYRINRFLRRKIGCFPYFIIFKQSILDTNYGFEKCNSSVEKYFDWEHVCKEEPLKKGQFQY
jgi:hypothetical protein